MPAIGFICPDKERITFAGCFNKCRLEDALPAERCKALPYLRKCASEREWKGEPSTTQLLRGTRESWLKITKPYYIDPDDRAFAILGTASHAVLDRFGHGDHLTEERLRDEICSGAFDFYDGETMTLYDYKTWGSYKIQQAMGISSVDVPDLDDDGNAILKKTGKNKGEPKTHKEYTLGNSALRVSAILETSIQLSDYRDKLLTVLPKGYTVKKMAIQVISRDGGLLVANMRGIEEKAPLLPLHGVSSHWVRKYMARKREWLLVALERRYAPKCRKRETWFGRKCSGYCEVSEICAQIG